jgi:hypothetical protein
MLERIESKSRKPNAQTKVEYKRCADGDRQLFAATNSSIQAAFYWSQQDYQHPGSFVAINVPVCLISLPFWDVCIDGGQVAEPEVRHRGYQTNLYPSWPGPQEAMSLVWSADDISQLLTALDNLYTWFRAEVQKPESGLL